MTEQYRKRLVELAKQIEKLERPEYLNTPEGLNFVSKLNYLLGYIMALEEDET